MFLFLRLLIVCGLTFAGLILVEASSLGQAAVANNDWMQNALNIYDGKPSDADFAILEKTVKDASAVKPFTENEYRIVNTIANVFEIGGKYELAKRAFTLMQEASVNAADDDLKKKMNSNAQASIAKLDLIGQSIEISGKTLSGADFSLDQFRGKVVLVDFWATWCGPCVAEMPNVKDNYAKYHERGFEVIGVCLDEIEKAEAVRKFVEEHQIPWPNLFSTNPDDAGWNHPLAVKLGVKLIPATFLIDREGKISAVSVRGVWLEWKLREMFE